MTSDNVSMERMRAKITQDLITSGKYTELAGLLQHRLRDSQWTEQVEELIVSTIKRNHSSKQNLSQILAEIEVRAVGEDFQPG